MFWQKFLQKLILFFLLFNNIVWCFVIEPRADSLDTPKKYVWDDVFITAKVGRSFSEPSGEVFPGFTASAGLGVGITADIYLKPSVTFWQARTKENHPKTEHSIGYMLSIEAIMQTDGFSIPVSCGFGSFSLENSVGGQPGMLAELGVLYPLNNVISIYAGGGYLNIFSLDFGGSEDRYSIMMLSAGLYFYIE